MQRTACNCGHGLSACPDTACERSCPRSCAGAAGLQHRYSWAAPVWDEVDDTSILKTGRHGRYRRFHPGHCTHNRAVRLSWLSRSDLVLWPEASVSCVAAIRPESGVKPTCRDRSTDAVDPGCVKTLRGITAPGILGYTVTLRAKKRKNLSSARHYKQIRFRFHTWGNYELVEPN